MASFKLININYTIFLTYIQEEDKMLYVPKMRPLPSRDRQSLVHLNYKPKERKSGKPAFFTLKALS